MVTSYKMIESEIGYRGSKSTVGAGLNSEAANDNFKLSFSVVKEQRVDGNCIGGNRNLPMLRCILMGFERNYQIRILSKSINKISSYRNFSTLPSSGRKLPNSKANLLLSPPFIAGFVDGEGSFSVTLIKDKSYKLG